MKEYRASKESPYHISCGGPIYRLNNGVREYALLFWGETHGAYRDTWHISKGTLNEGEPLEVCAEREIEEESGLQGERRVYLGALHDQWISEEKGHGVDKTVHYFLFRYLGGDVSRMDSEHDRVEWFTADEAKDKLNTMAVKNEAQIIDRAEAWFKKEGL